MKKLFLLLIIALPVLTCAKESIFDAASKGDSNFIVSYIANGGDVNAKCMLEDYYWWTPLIFAVNRGHADIVKLLISAKADVNQGDGLSSATPLMFAADNGYANIIKLLLDAGANPNFKDSTSLTALMHASALGDTNEMKILIDAGTDLNWEYLGVSALSIASFNKHEAAVKMLKDAGAR